MEGMCDRVCFINRMFHSIQLTEQPCVSLVKYLVKHNISTDQSPIVTNMTNVTLSGVQPGKTYSIEIIPYLHLPPINGEHHHLIIS